MEESQEIILTPAEDGSWIACVKPDQSQEVSIVEEGVNVQLTDADISEIQGDILCQCGPEISEDKCPLHCSLFCLDDPPVTGPSEEQALHSLPDGLVIKRSESDSAGVGVWAAMDFQERTRFGPFKGMIMDHIDQGHTSGCFWQVFKNGKTNFIVDSYDRSQANWMRYINMARCEKEQNLKAYIHDDMIYYKSTCDISSGTELLLYHEKNAILELGLRDFNIKPFSVNGTEMIRCPLCKRCFDTELTLFKHSRNRHGGSSLTNHLTEKLFGVGKNGKKDAVSGKNDHVYLGSGKFRGKGRKKLSSDEGESEKVDGIKDGDNVIIEMNEDHVLALENSSNNADLESKKTLASQEPGDELTKVSQQVMTDLDKVVDESENEEGIDPAVESMEEGSRDNFSPKATSIVASTLKGLKVGGQIKEKLQCDYCQKIFVHYHRLKSHMRIHTGEKAFSCYVCEKQFANQITLKKHMKEHGNLKAFKCECGKEFTHSHHLLRHQRIHTGERPHKCEHCGKGYADLNELKKHLLVHLGIKPYVCDLCGMAFHQSQTLNRHKRSHTGERPYKCDICGKGFTRLMNVKVHKRLHEGVKPYECSTCGKDFNQLSNLRTHQKVHSRGKKLIQRVEKMDRMKSDSVENGGEDIQDLVGDMSTVLDSNGEAFEVSLEELQKQLSAQNSQNSDSNIIIIRM